jgi:FixJ family two-component response regulator
MKRNQTPIYVVDDDESVRESVTVFLRSFEFDAQPFESAEAFFTLGAHAETAALAGSCLVLDITMPGMGGERLQEHLLEAGRCPPSSSSPRGMKRRCRRACSSAAPSPAW